MINVKDAYKSYEEYITWNKKAGKEHEQDFPGDSWDFFKSQGLRRWSYLLKVPFFQVVAVAPAVLLLLQFLVQGKIHVQRATC